MRVSYLSRRRTGYLSRPRPRLPGSWVAPLGIIGWSPWMRCEKAPKARVKRSRAVRTACARLMFGEPVQVRRLDVRESQVAHLRPEVVRHEEEHGPPPTVMLLGRRTRRRARDP